MIDTRHASRYACGMRAAAGFGLIVVMAGLMLAMPTMCGVAGGDRRADDPYDVCVRAGDALFREQGLAVVEGRRADAVVRERCMRSAGAFGS